MGLLIVEEALCPWPSIAPSAHVPLSPHLYATAQYFSCSLSHYLFSVSLGNQTGVQSTFTTFYEVECDVIDGGRASQLSTHPPTCAEGATLETGSGDSSTVSNLLSHLFLYSSGGGGKTHDNGGFFDSFSLFFFFFINHRTHSVNCMCCLSHLQRSRSPRVNLTCKAMAMFLCTGGPLFRG